MLAVCVKRTNSKAEVECQTRMHISKEDFSYRAGFQCSLTSACMSDGGSLRFHNILMFSEHKEVTFWCPLKSPVMVTEF
jgi:hypothetical protein